MDILSLLSVLILFSLLFLLVFVCLFDADLTTIFCEKFGVDVKSKLKDKVVWITGASSGIGEALAIECVKNGSKVVISARREAQLESVKSKCLDAVPGCKSENILVLPMDMCDFDSHKKCFDQVLNTFGRLDILINNAGRSQRARWEYTDIDVDIGLFQLNVFSVINLTRLVLPHMLENKTGTIAVTSSSAGKVGAPFSGTYTGSKHAIHGYFESLRTEKAGTGIDICLLCPGPTFSGLLEVAATEKVGEQFGENMSSGDKRMTSERCAQLSLVAIANRLYESWICFFPVILIMYLNQYAPGTTKLILSVVGPKLAAKIRDSKNAMESKKFQ